MSQTITDSLQVVSFSLINQLNGKKEDYAIPIEQVKEIRTLDEITEVPNTKSYVKGVMNLRGTIIPILDVKNKLGFGKTDIVQKSKQRILVADVNDNLYGLLIDDVDQVLRISTKDIDEAPKEAFDSFNHVKGIAKTSSKLIVILDVLSLLDNQESIPSEKNEQKSDLDDKISDDHSSSANADSTSNIQDLDNQLHILNEKKTKLEEIASKLQEHSTENNQVNEEEIPPELKAVLEEDANEESSIKDNSDKFQNRVKRETDRIQTDTP